MSKNIIIGSGLIGSAFLKSYTFDFPVLFFASGVSNSKTTSKYDFQREIDLINHVSSSIDDDTLFVYFSSCGVGQINKLNDDLYLQHKFQMEQIVSKLNNYLIIRLPQVAGFSSNKNTLLNYIYDSLISGRRMLIQQSAFRNIIDIDDVVSLTMAILKSREYRRVVIDVANLKNILVVDLIKIMEIHVGIPAVFDLIEGGCDYFIDSSVINRFAPIANVTFDESYIPKVFMKYYKSCASF